MLKASEKMPDATVSLIEDQGFKDIQIRDLFRDGLNILVGLPGAFTPVCTEEHLPSLIKNAEIIRKLGVKGIYCISDDHRWALDEWRKNLPGSEAVSFLSDGNRDFLHKIKMQNPQRDLYIEGRYSRFYALIHEGIIKRIRAEQNVLYTISTTRECILTDIQDILSRHTKCGM